MIIAMQTNPCPAAGPDLYPRPRRRGAVCRRSTASGLPGRTHAALGYGDRRCTLQNITATWRRCRVSALATRRAVGAAPNRRRTVDLRYFWAVYLAADQFP